MAPDSIMKQKYQGAQGHMKKQAAKDGITEGRAKFATKY
jgi:hypothetical protein